VEAQRAALIKSKQVYGHSFDYGLKVLEEALAIGRQAGAPMAVVDARSRMDEVQSRALRPTPLSDSPVFAKIKSWFEPKEQTEPAA
jgi:hypothetical protein